MDDGARLIELVDAKKETDYVDYKKKYYSEDKKYDLIKDVVAFANNCSTSNDRYIVFGIVNGTWDLEGVCLENFPDSSDIADLLNVYVEPFLSIETGTFKHDNVDLAYIKIPVQGINRPYIIKKQYEKNGRIHLRIGEIYVRKGTSNFIANRMDLDYIYRSNGRLAITLHSDEIEIGEITAGRASEMMVQVRLLINNTFGHSVNICDMKCDLITATGRVELEGAFFEDMTKRFTTVPTFIEDQPLLLDSGAERQKSLFARISKDYVQIVREFVDACKQYKVRITCKDANEKTYTSDEIPVTIRFYGNIAH